MAMGVYFDGSAMTAAQYDDVVKRLAAVGPSNPKIQLFHSCFGESGSLSIFHVWESQADFDQSAETLMAGSRRTWHRPGPAQHRPGAQVLDRLGPPPRAIRAKRNQPGEQFPGLVVQVPCRRLC